MSKSITLLFVAVLLMISACASPEYACGVPGGIGCKPLREVQQMAEEGRLKGQPAPDHRDQVEPDLDDDDNEDAFTTDAPFPSWMSNRPPTGLATVTPGSPLLIPPRTLRIWVERWTDDGGTLHDETYLYLRLDNGHWIMEKS